MLINFKNDPFELLDKIFNDDFLFENSSNNPSHDIVEEEEDYILEIMLPGFEKDNISISVEKDALIIEGERNVPEDKQFNRKGSFFGKFKKTFTLPDNIIIDNIDASLKNGILSVKIPKDVEKKLSKTIKIK